MRLNPRVLGRWLAVGDRLGRAGLTVPARVVFWLGRQVFRDTAVLFIAHVAMLDLDRGDNRSAIAAYSKILVLDPQDSAWHALLGKAYEAEGELDEALISYRRALALGAAWSREFREEIEERTRKLEALGSLGKAT